MLEEGWGPVRKIERIAVFVEEPKGRGKSPFEENQRAVEGQEGALWYWDAVVLEYAVGSGSKLSRCQYVTVCRIWVARKPNFASPSVNGLKNGDI